ncbi:hypothetical protein T07_3112 [Trichinella nelsoni]|uniref:Uncharacterized protein n=1 Tax=Trichinella nelsoni TaxID=6336 RepID=A0A0V0RPQ3_9BILA|nr:hypothetical protein T07_3112 [Trichinella nelsoni]
MAVVEVVAGRFYQMDVRCQLRLIYYLLGFVPVEMAALCVCRAAATFGPTSWRRHPLNLGRFYDHTNGPPPTDQHRFRTFQAIHTATDRRSSPFTTTPTGHDGAPFACRTNWVGKVGNNKRWVVLQAAAGVVSDRSVDPLPAVKNFSFTT